MAKLYNCRPSAFFDLGEYEAYCLDEACAYIQLQLKEGKEPVFEEDKKQKHFKKASDLYKNLGLSK